MPRRRLLVAALTAAAATGAPHVGAAQVAAPAQVSRNACLDTLPDSALHRVPVYLTPGPVDSAGPRMPLQDGIDLLTQAVAHAGRSLLGGTEGTLPVGDSSLGWRALDGHVLVVARRNGTMTARPMPPRHPTETWASDAGALFVARALDSAWARGDRLLFPDSAAIDSAIFRLHLEPGIVNEQGEFSPPKMRVGIPIFSAAVPTQRHVAAERVRVTYPPRLRQAGFMGNVIMQFVVDTAGRVDSATVRDLFPVGQPRLGKADQEVYDEFVRSIRAALVRARYRPARRGGCAVRQLVQQPFTFSLGGPPPPP